MAKISITAKKKDIGGLLPVGDHIVEITEAGMELSKENDVFNDQTPQLKIVCKSAKGQITAWMNLKGYKNASDTDGVAPKGFEFRSFNEDSEKFLVDKKTSKRVQSDERTANLHENVGNLAFAADIEGEIDLEELPAELTGKQVGVRVRENKQGRLEAYYFMLPSEVKASAAIAE